MIRSDLFEMLLASIRTGHFPKSYTISVLSLLTVKVMCYLKKFMLL